jgi:uncharacterized membrane protein
MLGRPSVESIVLASVAGVTAAVLGVIAIERRSIWIDEAIDVGLTGLPWGDYLRVAFEREGSQALYLLFLKPWLALTSDDEWVARAPSVAFAALACALLVLLALRLFGSRLCALGAGLLLATNALSVAWSQQIRQYALAMLLAVVVTYLFAIAVESDGWRWWLVYGAVAGVSVYAHFFVGLVVASHVPALVVPARRRLLFVRWGAAAGLAFVVALPALNFVFRHDTGQVSWIPEADYWHIRTVLYEVGGESWLALLVGAAGALVLVADGVGGRRPSWEPILVVSWLITPFALTLLISMFKPMLLERYLIVSVPALALATAYVVSRLGRWPGVVALALLLAIAVTHVRDWYGSYIEQDWRSAVGYVEREKRAGERVFVYPWWQADSVTYYASSNADTSETLRGDRAWVVSLSERGAEVDQWVAASGYEVTDHKPFAGVDVWRVETPREG